MKTRDLFSILALAFASLALGCSGDSTTGPETLDNGLNTELLDSLFTNFSPAYNYTDEETLLLGHVAQVTVPGYDPWLATLGHADTLQSAPVSASSVFRVGSATKMFTAVVILQMWEEGLIDLDAPFNAYLDLDEETFPNIGQFTEVTVRHLLSHRAGIPPISSTTFFDVYEYTDSVPPIERLRFIFSEGEPEWEPGMTYGYRNSNFTILGLIIERVAGAPYHEVLRERIYSRIGLTNTHLLDYDISVDAGWIAHGYFWGFDGTHYHGSQAWSSGGLMSNVQDLTTFITALAEGDLFQQPSTFQMMVTPEPGSPYGLGIFVTESQQGPHYGHGGGVFGYNTRLEYFPTLDVVVVSTMSFHGINFMVTNWYEDFCYPVVAGVRGAVH